MVFALGVGAIGEVRCPRSQDGRGLGAVDFDIATNSQGLEVRRFTVRKLSRDASHASVVESLASDNWVRKSERENEIRYDFVWSVDAGRSTTSNPSSSRTHGRCA
jgi:hypothetical protein